MGVFEKSIDILELIPQRPPMVLVDRFEGIDSEGVSSTSLIISSDSLFVEDGYLTECGIIEHMAQSAAARVGWLSRQAGKQTPIGFIGSVAKFSAPKLPSVGDILITSLSIIQQIGSLSLVEITTTSNDQIIASGQLKIFLQQ